MVVKDSFHYSKMVALRGRVTKVHILRPAGMGGAAVVESQGSCDRDVGSVRGTVKLLGYLYEKDDGVPRRVWQQRTTTCSRQSRMWRGMIQWLLVSLLFTDDSDRLTTR